MKFSIEILRIYSFWLLAGFLLGYFLHLAKEFLAIGYLLNQYKNTMQWLTLWKFILWNFIPVAIWLIAILSPIAFIAAILRAKAKNLLFFAEIRSIDTHRRLKYFGIIIIIINLLLLGIDQQWGRSLAKQSEIIFTDELVKAYHVDSQYEYRIPTFLRLQENNFLFFRNLNLDPVNAETPILNDILLWRISDQQEDFLAARQGRIEDGKIISDGLRTTLKIDGDRLNHSKQYYKALAIDTDLFSRSVRKYETVTPLALTISETLALLQVQQTFMSSHTALAYLILPFMLFLAIPMFIIALGLHYAKNKQ